MSNLAHALRLLNEAAHVAAKVARKSQDPRAAELIKLARQTDDLIDKY